VTVPSPSDTFCTRTFAGTRRPIELSTAAAVDARTESGNPRPPRVTESTRTATFPALAYGAPVITNCVVPKKTFAVAVSRTPAVVVLTTGSCTVTPLMVCGNEEAAAFVSSSSVTVRVNVDGGVALADGRAVGDDDGVGDTVGVGNVKTTRDGPQSRTTKNPTTNTAASKASRTRDLTL
jgi:hypothetical protein